LYGIINRDYKDFITIATKVSFEAGILWFISSLLRQLEGVDIRVEQIRKPLLDLRKDLTILNDTMVSNVHAIREKLIQKEEVRHLEPLSFSLNLSTDFLPKKASRIFHRVHGEDQRCGIGALVPLLSSPYRHVNNHLCICQTLSEF
jgi:hypothetical protein